MCVSKLSGWSANFFLYRSASSRAFLRLILVWVSWASSSLIRDSNTMLGPSRRFFVPLCIFRFSGWMVRTMSIAWMTYLMKKQHKQNHKPSEITKSGSHISLRNVREEHWQENPGNVWTNWHQSLTSWWPIAEACNLVPTSNTYFTHVTPAILTVFAV